MMWLEWFVVIFYFKWVFDDVLMGGTNGFIVIRIPINFHSYIYNLLNEKFTTVWFVLCRGDIPYSQLELWLKKSRHSQSLNLKNNTVLKYFV